MFTAKVVRKTHLDLKKAGAALKGPTKVKVGFVAGESDSFAIEKAVFNEFGTKGGASGGGWGGPIPERPFMRNAMRDNAGKYRRDMKTAAANILKGETSLRTVLSKLGIAAEGDIRDEIDALSSPPNSPVTIALKGSSNPLIDTGAMIDNVRYKVDE